MTSSAIENIYNQYIDTTKTSGNTLGGDAGIKSISYENGELLFEENDGDNISVKVGDLSDDILNGLNEKFGITIKSENKASGADSDNSTKGAGGTDKTEKTISAEELSLKQAELATKKTEKSALASKSDMIKETVTQLSAEIEETLADAVKKQTKATEEEQTRIENIIQQEIAQFKQDKEDGKDVNAGTLCAKIQSAMESGGFNSQMQVLMSNLILTNSKINQMETLLGELNIIDEQIRDLDDKIGTLNDEIASAESSRHDPIGYTSGDITYEFVIDKDNSGDLTDVNEFLGAENNFDEMVALDNDNSGNVDKSELDTAGVKVLVTNTSTGEQVLKNLDEVFGDSDVSIDTANFKDLSNENAVAENGQQLLGNFNITVGNESFVGYSTLDTDEYLAENYTFSGATSTDTAAADGISSEFVTEYTEKLQEYKEQFDQILADLEYNESLIMSMKEAGAYAGILEAQSQIEEFTKAASEKIHEDDEDDAAEDAGEANTVTADDTTEDPDDSLRLKNRTHELQ